MRVAANNVGLLSFRYLATGDDQKTIANSYRLGRSTVHEIVTTTCKALWDVLQPLHVAVPNAQKWESLAFEFWRYWDFPNAIGSIDGKHVQIRAPFNSEYRNYKVFFSIVLMVVADARYGWRNTDGRWRVRSQQ